MLILQINKISRLIRLICEICLIYCFTRQKNIKTKTHTHTLLTCAGCVFGVSCLNQVVLDHLQKDLETETSIMWDISPATSYIAL